MRRVGANPLQLRAANVLALGLGLALGVIGIACSRESGDSTDGRLFVVATTMFVGDLVRSIGADDVRLRTLMGPGVDPHTYKPSPADYEDLKLASVVFYNGLHLEGKMVGLLERRLGDRAVAVTRDISADRLLSWRAGQGVAHDPHVWLDVSLWMQAAKTVGRELARRDPLRAARYSRRLDRLLSDLLNLHQWMLEKAQGVPPQRRVLITSHDAFSYFGQAYGFEVRGLQGISTETEAGLVAIQGAVDFMIQRQIPALFVESSVSGKSIQRVCDDCAARGFAVRIGGELFSDAMGGPGQHPPYAVETYLGMMRYNMDTIVNALSR